MIAKNFLIYYIILYFFRMGSANMIVITQDAVDIFNIYIYKDVSTWFNSV